MYGFAKSKAILLAPKYYRACIAADVVIRRIPLEPSIGVVATLLKISPSSVSRALRLTPEERAAVRRRERALVPRAAAPVTPESPQQRLDGIVAEIGVEGTLDLLAKHNGGCPTSWQFPLPLSDAA